MSTQNEFVRCPWCRHEFNTATAREMWRKFPLSQEPTERAALRAKVAELEHRVAELKEWLREAEATLLATWGVLDAGTPCERLDEAVATLKAERDELAKKLEAIASTPTQHDDHGRAKFVNRESYLYQLQRADRLVARNKKLEAALHSIEAMLAWAGRWRVDEEKTTSYARMNECYAIASAALEDASPETVVCRACSIAGGAACDVEHEAPACAMMREDTGCAGGACETCCGARRVYHVCSDNCGATCTGDDGPCPACKGTGEKTAPDSSQQSAGNDWTFEAALLETRGLAARRIAELEAEFEQQKEWTRIAEMDRDNMVDAMRVAEAALAELQAWADEADGALDWTQEEGEAWLARRPELAKRKAEVGGDV